MQITLVSLCVGIPKTRFKRFGTIKEHMINTILNSLSYIIELNLIPREQGGHCDH